jgi:hypothetical protein
LGHENAIAMVVEYDEKLLLPLLMVANKLLMLDMVKRLVIEVDFEGLTHDNNNNKNNNKHIRGHCVKGACWISTVSY